VIGGLLFAIAGAALVGGAISLAIASVGVIIWLLAMILSLFARGVAVMIDATVCLVVIANAGGLTLVAGLMIAGGIIVIAGV